MKKNNRKKKLLIAAVSLLLAAAVILGVVFLGGEQESVGVYPFHMVGMDGYWGDSQESYGPVSTDKIQTVYLSDTQTVTEVLVAQGDPVKKGEVLMTFDTSLSELQLERKRLEVEKLKLQLTEAKEELRRIANMKPMEVPDIPEPTIPTVNPGKPIPGPYVYQQNVVKDHDGLTAETAFICWLRSDTQIGIPLLEEMRQFLWNYHKLPALCQHGNLPDSCESCEKCEHDLVKITCPVCNCTHGEDCPHCIPCEHGVIRALCTQCSPLLCQHGNIEQYCETCHPCPHGNPPSQCPTCSPALCEPHGEIEEFCPKCHPPQCIHGSSCDICTKCEHGILRKDCDECSCPHGDDCTICNPPAPKPTEPDPTQPQQPDPASVPEPTEESQAASLSASGPAYRIQFLSRTDDSPEDAEGGASGGTGAVTSTDMTFFVVFKTTAGDTDLAMTSLWQGVQVIYKDGLFSQQFFTPMMEDYTLPKLKDDSASVIPEIDFGSGMTATQIANMRVAQEKKIKEIEFDIKMATAEHRIMQKELGDGNIYAEIDGKVVSVLTEEEAKQQHQPVMKVSGGGGFFIQGSVSELEKDSLKPGQEVTVNDWSNGGVYTGTVKEIGDFPSIDGYWNGAGNPNTTYYPFTVFVGEEASLQAGSYANIQYSTSAASAGIYMDKAFLRTEDGRTYAYVRGADNRLEKRFLTTGKSLWGSYVEILSGLTVEDYIAFPYGKDVKSGAPAEEKDLSELYGY